MQIMRAALATGALTLLVVSTLNGQIGGQAPGGGRGGRAGGPPAPQANLPTAPTAVALPML